jgi:hypothetical protein
LDEIDRLDTTAKKNLAARALLWRALIGTMPQRQVLLLFRPRKNLPKPTISAIHCRLVPPYASAPHVSGMVVRSIPCFFVRKAIFSHPLAATAVRSDFGAAGLARN